MSSKSGATIGGCLIGLIVVAVACALAMVLGALTVGTTNAWFMAGDFSAGWSNAWASPLKLLGFSVLFYGILAGIFGFNRD